MRTRFAPLAALLLGVLPMPLSAGPAHVIGRASVIDGDTIEIRGERIRLTGIDAPESSQSCTGASGASWPCGRRAAFALADLVGTGPVECEQIDRDRYGRMVAICVRDDGTDLSRWMVQEGYAIAFRRYSTAYVAEEGEAKASRKGLWAGGFMDPSEYRRRRAP